ncbi:carbohydrate kinase family protein [Spirosoma rhododendri]|uniref:Carbohydrate kinase n=1 Tax=Spirosoma rhododendri TaxID=2728024 RepID=A0A7L5DP09_9BACT|nr:carbohydrate kinase [Spirosoma rhododendri]QJD80189.1 carbohydrate kinase [Spirosoma rhododendri]
MSPLITCFGEVLWDVLPTSRQAGGAPMNVAADLRNFGVNAQIISRVGDDELGVEMVQFLSGKGIPTDLVQIGKTHLTGVAKANISDAHEVTYKIVQPVAWDYIQPDAELTEAVRNSDLFVFGSLAARSPLTRDTLMGLLSVARRTVFDVNLRAPHYERALIEDLLQQTDIAKLNEHELIELSEWYGYEPNLHRAMEQLRDRYQLETLCVTLGEAGAVMLDRDGFTTQPGFDIDVEDTIGSGDAFLAAFLFKTLQQEPPQHILEFACATGAYVATQRGATPAFTEETIQSMFLDRTEG